MPSRADVFIKLIDLIVEELSVSKSDISEDTDFLEDLDADSLDIVNLVMGIEEEFKITIPDEHIERITTVKHTIDYILDHSAS
jgi:acyl carrier protein